MLEKISTQFLRTFVFSLLCLTGLNSNAQVVAGFSSPQPTGCAPLLVQFNDQSTGNPTYWQWDFGNGNTSNLQNPSAIYITPGVYSISLTAARGTDTSRFERRYYVSVFANPVADFSAADTIGCSPLDVQFTDRSVPQSASISQWFWTFGDGSSSTVQNPLHTYNSNGLFSVYLLVRDGNGCQNSKWKTNQVKAYKPTAQFACDTFFCKQTDTVFFNNTSSGINLTYQWDFGNGMTSTVQNPYQVYASPGNYTITLIATDEFGCTNTFSKNIRIIDFRADFEYWVTCHTEETYTIALTNLTNPPATFRIWSASLQYNTFVQNPSFYYDSIENSTIKLISYYQGCVDSIEKTYIPPTARFTYNGNRCQPPFISPLTNQSSGSDSLTFLWIFPDSTTSTARDTAFEFTIPPNDQPVTLIVTNRFGCTVEETLHVHFALVDELIGRPFEVQGCIPVIADFTAANIGYIAATAFWDFGDTASGPLNYYNVFGPVTHVYNSHGEYTVRLQVVTTTGCTFNDSVIVFAGILPDSMNFLGPDTICHHTIAQFYNATFYSDTSIHINHICWAFHFTDYPIYDSLWNIIGHFNTWEYLDTLGLCNDTGYNHLYVSYATVSNPVHNYHEYIISQMYNSYYNINNTNIYIPEYQGTFGIDTVGLRVGYNGCYSIMYKTIYKHPPAALPGYRLGMTDWCMCYDPVCDFPYFCTLSACSSPATIGLYNAAIDWTTFNHFAIVNVFTGDTVASLPNLPDTFYVDLNAGMYFIKLSVTNDSTGCTDQELRQITVDSVSTRFSFVQDSINCRTVQFSDSSVSHFGQVYMWYWDFGDGTYLYSGYDTLIPHPFFHRDPTDIDIITDLYNGTAYPPGYTPLFVEDMYLYNSGTYASPRHIYPDTGYYQVRLVLGVLTTYRMFTDFEVQYRACIYEYRDSVHIQAGFAKFEASDVTPCLWDSIYFSNLSYSNNGSIASSHWLFGDGSPINTATNPVYLYPDSGLYTIQLAITDAAGCRDTLKKSEYLYVTNPESELTVSAVDICPGDSINLSGYAFGFGLSYWLDMGDGTLDFSGNAWHVYNNPGSFPASFNVTDVNACLKRDTVTIRVHDLPTAGFTADTIFALCPPLPVTFINTSTGGDTQWIWSFGDGQVSVNQHPHHIYTTSGLYTISLISASQYGCSDTSVMVDYIFVGGPSGNFSFAPDTLCAPDQSLFISNLNSTLIRYWDFGDGTVSSQIVISDTDSSNHVYFDPGIYLPVLILEDSIGCRITVLNSDSVYVDRTIASFTSGDTIKCDTGPVQFINLSQTFFPTQFLWSSSNNLVSANISPAFDYDTSGTYTINLSLLSTLGCTSDTAITIYVNKAPAISFQLPALKDCIPLQVSANASNSDSMATVEQWYWNYGDGSSSAGPQANHLYPSAGEFTLTLKAVYGGYYCSKDTAVVLKALNPAIAGFGYTPTIPTSTNNTVSFYDLSSNATSWFWNLDQKDSSDVRNPSYTFPESGTYYITQYVTNEGLCPDSITRKIYVSPNSFIELPNAFSPNSDGKNDVLHLFYAGIIELYEWKIYNRWGELVFETNDLNASWDGSFRGRQQDVGTFVYYISAKAADRETAFERKGTFSLIR